jgi:PASTA domain-containing protein/putative Ig domain-containing protein
MADPGTVSVPRLVSLMQSSAEEMLKSAGLVVGAVTTVNSSTAPKGSVSGATPSPGALVSLGSAVNLEISSGPTQGTVPNVSGAPQPAQVSVPNVVGLTRTAAEAILKSSDLVLGAVKTQHSNSVPDGGVSGTNPDAGTLVSSGSQVELDLSSGPETNWTQYIPTALFALLGFTVLGLIVYGITEKDQKFLTNLANKEVARGLITFLVALATVGIAIILAISTLVLTEGEAGDKRFDRGKQVLSVLIGVLGTIVGFYFGADTNSVKQINPTVQTQTSTQKITTTTLPDGAANKAYPSTTIETTGLTAPLTWSVDPALPAGLALDTKTGIISGTPTAPMPKKSFKFAVTDSASPPVTSTVDLKLEIK